LKQLTLTLNCEIEKYKVADKYFCTFREYDLSESSERNFDEAEEKLINKIHKYAELEMWDKDLKLEIKINYKK